MKEAPARTPTRFLARMVERAGERAPSVLPRLPGLFEPSGGRPAGVHDPVEAGPESERVERSEWQPTSSRASSEEAQTRRVLGAGLHIETESRSHGGENARAQRTADAERTGNALGASTREARTAHALPVQHSQAPPTESQANPSRSAVLLPAAAPVKVEVGDASTSHDRDQRDDAGASQTTPSTPAPRIGEEKPTRVLMPQPVAWTPSLAPSVPAQATVRSDEHAAPSPVIHISIGRVEVRAQQPSVPAAKTRDKPRRPMSLDEYFKRQERAR